MIKFAPCSFCDRKAGFFSNNKNYCWVHWPCADKHTGLLSNTVKFSNGVLDNNRRTPTS